MKKYDMAQDEIFEKLFNEMIDEAARQMSEQDHEDISPAEVHFSPEHEKKMSLKKLMAVGLSAMLSLAFLPLFLHLQNRQRTCQKSFARLCLLIL